MRTSIVDLRDRPDFAAIVADRLWTAWWQSEGSSRADVLDLVRASLVPDLVPTCLVAHDADRFLATASLIAADLSVRPHYTPWLAALWVEPEARSRGIGRALVSRIADAAFGGGVERLFLYCVEDRVGFYTGLGWRAVEHGVGPALVSILDLRMGEGGGTVA